MYQMQKYKIKNALQLPEGVFSIRSLTMTYSHMGRPHTTIG
ncbi:hypothetical protein J2X05_004291, partial [Cellvibrio fibrivorans]|nr:hypothetical protein [Cellvibrio fibrivorans]